MTSIINQIIEIDSIAQKRLNDAHAIEEEIKRQIVQKKQYTNDIINEKAAARIEKIEEIEQQYANEEMDRIKKEFDSKIARLEDIYTNTHEAIEAKIFNQVITV